MNLFLSLIVAIRTNERVGFRASKVRILSFQICLVHWLSVHRSLMQSSIQLRLQHNQNKTGKHKNIFVADLRSRSRHIVMSRSGRNWSILRSKRVRNVQIIGILAMRTLMCKVFKINDTKRLSNLQHSLHQPQMAHTQEQTGVYKENK